MSSRAVRLNDKTAEAPYFAEAALFHRVARFHALDFVDIMVVTSGSGIETIYRGTEEHRRPLHRGRMVLYRPGDDVMISTTTPEGMVVRYVSFPVGEWTSFAAVVGVDEAWTTSPAPPMVDVDLDDPSVLRPFEVVIERYAADPTPLDLARFWIDVVPVLFPATHRRLPGTGAPTWLRDSVEAMREETNLAAGVRRLLEISHVSPSHLSATTRRYYGRTPSALVLEMRLRHAALLLGSTTESVGRISERCGFASFSHFSAAFRRAYRIQPREYRARSAARFGTARH